MNDFFNKLYQKPYARITPYLFGLMTGYLLHKINRKVYIPKVMHVEWIVNQTLNKEKYRFKLMYTNMIAY